MPALVDRRLMAPTHSARDAARRLRVENVEVCMTRNLENGGRGEGERERAFTAVREIDSQRRRERPVESDADAIVVFQPVEVEIRRACDHLASVVENRHVEIAV